MFLRGTSQTGIIARFKHMRDEQGAALATVLGVFAVISVLALAMSVTMVNTLNITKTSQEDLHAQNSAESGIATAVASLNNGICPVGGLFTDSVSGTFAVQTQTRTGGGAWVNGCPSDLTNEVRFLSSGKGQIETTQIAAVFDYSPPAALPSGGGGLMGGFNDNDFLVNGSIRFNIAESAGADGIDKRKGDFNCTASAHDNIPGNVYVWDGDSTISGSCNVNFGQEFRVSGNMNIDGSGNFENGSTIYVGGDFSGTGATDTPSIIHAQGDLSLSGSAKIRNSVYVGQNLQVTGSSGITGATHVAGNAQITSSSVFGDPDPEFGSALVVKGNLTISSTSTIYGNVFVKGNVTISNSAKIYGNIYADGWVNISGWSAKVNGSVFSKSSISTAQSGNVTGTTNPHSSNLPPFPEFTVADTFPAHLNPPEWWDYVYNQAEWEALGYTNIVTLVANQCSNPYGPSANVGNGQHWGAYLSNLSTKTLIDARVCNTTAIGHPWNANTTVTMQTDIVIIANRFDFNRLHFQSNSTAERTLFLVTPDGNPGLAGPQCNANQGADINQFLTTTPQILGMLYTPCAVNPNGSDNFDWRGTLYLGNINPANSSRVTVTPADILLPGMPGRGSGGTIPSEGHGTVHTRTSQLPYTGSDAPAIPAP